MYLLRPGMDRTEAIIRQRLYWPGIRNSVQKEVTNCDTFQRTKQSNVKYGKLPAKESEEITRNKLCVDLIGTYVIRRKVQKEHLNLKAVTMIYPVTGWFEITQYNNKKAITMENLVETTWLSIYPRPMEITYDQGSEFIGRELLKYLLEMEYGITAKPSTSVNPTSNAILEWIQRVLGNLVRTCNITENYVDEDDL